MEKMLTLSHCEPMVLASCHQQHPLLLLPWIISVLSATCILIKKRLSFHILRIHSPLLVTFIPVESAAIVSMPSFSFPFISGFSAIFIFISLHHIIVYFVTFYFSLGMCSDITFYIFFIF